MENLSWIQKHDEIFFKNSFSKEDIVYLLSLEGQEEIEFLRQRAYDIATKESGEKVSLRGIIEFSNICSRNCCYCGIRKDAKSVKRYLLSREEIIEIAQKAAVSGYGSVVLQSGERNDEEFIKYVIDVVKGIKDRTKSEKLPEGLGITLSVGEQTEKTYKKFYDAGAHRYLLRIETSDKKFFSKIHPPDQKYDNRLNCLRMLKKIGYQVGTGVMIGIPGQTIDQLASDVLFFRDIDADMIGMGPYIVSQSSLMSSKGMMEKKSLLLLSLKMISATRVVLKDVNIASTTALEAISEDGREKGILFGANVVMPNLSPVDVKSDYLLYEGKPGMEEGSDEYNTDLIQRIRLSGREILFDDWGDSKHFKRRKCLNII
ncbi:[FeFe] hydrogenase H-cluster radical SAM maturase HydE [candidate division WOR-3 bacterium]|nr:[FeFe] hydrogenase H-cluster radical SAM maturase HydE [candidate division WOR-3 bacterium]